MSRYVVKLTLKQARDLHIEGCECGHAFNNHFDHSRAHPCAHCKCPKYVSTFYVGKSVKP